MNGFKVGERLQMNNVVSFQCDPGYTLQVNWFSVYYFIHSHSGEDFLKLCAIVKCFKDLALRLTLRLTSFCFGQKINKLKRAQSSFESAL